MAIFSMKLLGRHPSLVPLVAIVSAGGCLSAFYLLRLATKNPDVCWVKSNSEPWNEYETKQYKFYSPNIDYKTYKLERPKF